MMRPLLALTVALALTGTSCTTGSEDPPLDHAPGGSGRAEGAATADCPAGLDAAVDAWGDVGFNGVVTVLRGAEPCVAAAGVRDRANGAPMTDETVFAIGSVSKSFTAAAVVQLVAEGRLDLHATAGSLVAGLRGPAASATVAQLLTHTSGLLGGAGEDHQPLSHKAAVDALGGLPRVFPAGTDFGYTNGGYTLLALIIDSVTGDYRGYLADHLLDPAGAAPDAGFWDGHPAARGPRAVGYTEDGRSMQSGDFPGPHWAMSGNGDLAMSMPTLAALTAALFRGEILPDRATAALTKPRWDNGDGTSETYGWVRLGADVLGAVGLAAAGGGGDTGHNAVVAYLPASDLVVAIGSSTPEVNAEDLLQAIIVPLAAGDPVPLPAGPDTTPPDPEIVARAVGTYLLDGGGRLVLSGRGGSATISAVGAAAVDVLFARPTGISPGDLDRHAAAVLDLLSGDDPAGRAERRVASRAVGGIRQIELRGTVVDHRELRTYVRLIGEDSTLDGWYSLDEHGGVAAAQLPAEPPSLELDEQRGDALISADPTAQRPDVRVTAAHGVLTVDNGATVVTARRRG